MTRPNLYNGLGIRPTFDEAHKFVTSPVIRNPITLASIRSIIALYTLISLIFFIVWRSIRLHDGNSFFSFFTNLTLVGICAYYFAAAVQTWSYALAWRRKGAGAGYALQRWPRVLQALHVILHSTVVTYPILVTIVYWAVIATPETFSTPYSRFSNVTTHALNSVFALFDILLTNTPPPSWFALAFCVIFLGGYLGIAYITHGTQGFYPYEFLDPSKQSPGKLAIWILGILLAQLVIFALIKGIVHLRQRWAKKTGRVLKNYISGGSSKTQTGDLEALSDEEDWEEVARPSAPGSPEKENRRPETAVTTADSAIHVVQDVDA